jgi:hypothetical protein
MELKAINLLSKAMSKNEGEPGPGGKRDYFRGSWTWACGRRLWWEKKGEEYSNRANATSVEKMNKGTRYGEYIATDLINRLTDYIVVFCEEELEGEIAQGVRVRGHIDGILLHKDTLKIAALFECKTTSGFGFKAVVKNFGDRDHYSWGYVKQSTRYLKLWNDRHPEHATDTICVFLYNVNGDEDTTTSFPARDWWFTPTEADFNEDMRQLKEVARAKKLPKRGYETKSDWKCKTCSYYSKCWEL